MQTTATVIRCAGALTALTLAAALSGCASGPTKEECAAVDWRTLGYEDGINGRPQTRVGAHRKACAKHGVTLVLDDYRQGWQEGVERYCQPGNGYRQGRSGAAYQGVCPQQLEEDFLQAYRNGRDVYSVEKDVQQLSRALNSARSQLASLETAIRDTGLDLIAPGLPTAERVVLLDELRKLEAERSELRNHEIPALEHQLAIRRDDLAEMRASQAY